MFLSSTRSGVGTEVRQVRSMSSWSNANLREGAFEPRITFDEPDIICHDRLQCLTVRPQRTVLQDLIEALRTPFRRTLGWARRCSVAQDRLGGTCGEDHSRATNLRQGDWLRACPCRRLLRWHTIHAWAHDRFSNAHAQTHRHQDRRRHNAPQVPLGEGPSRVVARTSRIEHSPQGSALRAARHRGGP